MRNVIYMFLVVFSVSSCNDQAIYREAVSIPERGWHKDSAITFDVEITDTVGKYQILIDLRNNADYPFSNLFLFRHIESLQGVEFADTAQYLLADRNGKWLGTGVGAIKSSTFSYRPQALRFTRIGTYTFTLQHGMRETYLKGLEDIGIRVVPDTID